MNVRNCFVLVLLALTAVASAAGPDAKYKAPRTENGQPDLRGVWNFSSDVPLERPAAAADKTVWTREELAAQKAAKRQAFDLLAKVAPIEAVALTVLDFEGRTEDLRTSLITYPENGRLPKLVDGVRRIPGPEQIFAALANPGSAPSLAQFAAFLGGGKKDGAEDLSTGDRCLLGGGTPLIPGFDSNYVQIIQATDTVALVTESETRIFPLDGRPHVSERLRSWAGDSRGRWEGESLVIETRNFNRRTPSFAGAGSSLDKVVTERLTRVSKNALQYEATIVDPKTFQDKIVISLPMAHVDSRIYEYACHEGNYSLPMILAGARKDEREGNTAGPPPQLQQITLVDRQGKTVSTVAEPGVYRQAALSPDGTRVAVIRTDPETQDTDVWVYDVATGTGASITRDAAPNTSPVWSPDGSQIAYVTVLVDDNSSALSRAASNGSGREELLYKHPTNATIVLTDWSADGVLCFWSDKVTYALPVNGERKAVALSSGEFNVRGGRFSPDGRFLAFASDESGRFQVYARSFSLAASAAASPSVKPSPVSTGQAIGGIFWRQDGKELFFLSSPIQAVMAVDIVTSPEFQAGAPRSLFQVPGPAPGPAQLSNVSTRDGERFVFLVRQTAVRTPATTTTQR
jgi:hypothetical protein